MGANLTQTQEKEGDQDRNNRLQQNRLSEVPVDSASQLQLYQPNTYTPDITAFQDPTTEEADHRVGTSQYNSVDYNLLVDDQDGSYCQEESEYTVQNMLPQLASIPTISHNGGGPGGTTVEQSFPKSRTTYIDLDLLTTLENRIETLKDRNGCPVYYLGWTQQTIKAWEPTRQPNNFFLNSGRAVVVHLPPSLLDSQFFRQAKLPKHLLVLVHQWSTCGDLLDFCNSILADNVVQQQAPQPKQTNQNNSAKAEENTTNLQTEQQYNSRKQMNHIQKHQSMHQRSKSGEYQNKYASYIIPSTKILRKPGGIQATTTHGKDPLKRSSQVEESEPPKIVALRSVTSSSATLYCLDYYLTQRDLPLIRLSKSAETHVVPILLQQQRTQTQELVQKPTPSIQIAMQNKESKLDGQEIEDTSGESESGDSSQPMRSRYEILKNFGTGGPGIKDYELLRQVGKGGFSRVILARQRSTGRLCAMKVISIEELISQGKYKQTVLERKILLHMKHPFHVEFIEAFRTQKYLHLVLEFCPAGELFYHLSLRKKFSEDDARVIIAEIILAIEHLHKHNISYRDLKPENVLVDFRGHIKLTDFGLCKQRRGKSDLSKSLCGSPEYICPEMLNSGTHTRMVDFYQIGALLYELLAGLPPCYANDKKEMFDRIAKQNAKMPSHWSQGAKDLLTGLLEKDPEQRLGFNEEFEEVKRSEFFDQINWKTLLEKKRRGPLRPHLSGFYFDKEFVEELTLDEVKELNLEWVDYENNVLSAQMSSTRDAQNIQWKPTSGLLDRLTQPGIILDRLTQPVNPPRKVLSKASFLTAKNGLTQAYHSPLISKTAKKVPLVGSKEDKRKCAPGHQRTKSQIPSKQESQIFAESLTFQRFELQKLSSSNNKFYRTSCLEVNNQQSNSQISVNQFDSCFTKPAASIQNLTASKEMPSFRSTFFSRQKQEISPMLAPLSGPGDADCIVDEVLGTPVAARPFQLPGCHFQPQFKQGSTTRSSIVKVTGSGQMPSLGNNTGENMSPESDSSRSESQETEPVPLDEYIHSQDLVASGSQIQSSLVKQKMENDSSIKQAASPRPSLIENQMHQQIGSQKFPDTQVVSDLYPAALTMSPQFGNTTDRKGDESSILVMQAMPDTTMLLKNSEYHALKEGAKEGTTPITSSECEFNFYSNSTCTKLIGPHAAASPHQQQPAIVKSDVKEKNLEKLRPSTAIAQVRKIGARLFQESEEAEQSSSVEPQANIKQADQQCSSLESDDAPLRLEDLVAERPATADSQVFQDKAIYILDMSRSMELHSLEEGDSQSREAKIEMGELRSRALKRRLVKPHQVMFINSSSSGENDATPQSHQTPSDGLTGKQQKTATGKADQSWSHTVMNHLMHFVSERKRNFIQNPSGSKSRQQLSRSRTPIKGQSSNSRSKMTKSFAKPASRHRSPQNGMNSRPNKDVWPYKQAPLDPKQKNPLSSSSYNAAKKIYRETIVLDQSQPSNAMSAGPKKGLQGRMCASNGSLSARKPIRTGNVTPRTVKLVNSHSSLGSFNQTFTIGAQNQGHTLEYRRLYSARQSPRLTQSALKSGKQSITPIKKIPLLMIPRPESMNKSCISLRVSPARRIIPQNSADVLIQTSQPQHQSWKQSSAIDIVGMNINKSLVPSNFRSSAKKVLVSSISHSSNGSSANLPQSGRQLNVPINSQPNSINKIESVSRSVKKQYSQKGLTIPATQSLGEKTVQSRIIHTSISNNDRNKYLPSPKPPKRQIQGDHRRQQHLSSPVPRHHKALHASQQSQYLDNSLSHTHAPKIRVGGASLTISQPIPQKKQTRKSSQLPPNGLNQTGLSQNGLSANAASRVAIPRMAKLINSAATTFHHTAMPSSSTMQHSLRSSKQLILAANAAPQKKLTRDVNRYSYSASGQKSLLYRQRGKGATPNQSAIALQSQTQFGIDRMTNNSQQRPMMTQGRSSLDDQQGVVAKATGAQRATHNLPN